MLSFPAEVAIAQGRAETHPKLAAFVKELQSRPAYKRGLEKGGEYSFAVG
jgi:glutathione S-transferase